MMLMILYSDIIRQINSKKNKEKKNNIINFRKELPWIYILEDCLILEVKESLIIYE